MVLGKLNGVDDVAVKVVKCRTLEQQAMFEQEVCIPKSYRDSCCHCHTRYNVGKHVNVHCWWPSQSLQHMFVGVPHTVVLDIALMTANSSGDAGQHLEELLH